MDAAARNQPLRIFLNVVSDELIHRRREADDFRRHVVDEHSAINSDLIKVIQKGFRRPTVFFDAAKSFRDFFIRPELPA